MSTKPIEHSKPEVRPVEKPPTNPGEHGRTGEKLPDVQLDIVKLVEQARTTTAEVKNEIQRASGVSLNITEVKNGEQLLVQRHKTIERLEPIGEIKKPAGEKENPAGEIKKPAAEGEHPSGEIKKPTTEVEKPKTEVIEAEKAVDIKVEANGEVDKKSLNLLQKVWNHIEGPADVKIVKTIAGGCGIFSVVSLGFGSAVPGGATISLTALGFATMPYVSYRNTFVRSVFPKLTGFCATRKRAPVKPAENPSGKITIQSSIPFEPRVDYWNILLEGGYQLSREVAIEGLIMQYRSYGIEVKPADLATFDVADVFNRTLAWFDATETQFWSEFRPALDEEHMASDTIAAQFVAMSFHRELCRLSYDTEPAQQWVWPNPADGLDLTKTLVETYNSTGSGAMYDAMALYRYQVGSEEIVLPRCVSCDIILDALGSLYNESLIKRQTS